MNWTKRALLNFFGLLFVLFFSFLILYVFEWALDKFYEEGVLIKNQSKIVTKLNGYIGGPCFRDFYKSENLKERKQVYVDSLSADYHKSSTGVVLSNHISTFHNVNEGLRKSCNSDHGGSTKYFFFGGSTMEGVGVKDCETIPSIFAALNKSVNVFNHGVRGNALFHEVSLLTSVTPPKGSKVIFLDGLNDLFYSLQESEDFENLPASSSFKIANTKLYRLLSNDLVFKAKSELVSNESSVEECQVGDKSEIKVTRELSEKIEDYVNRYVVYHTKALSECYRLSLDCFFFLQPVPSYSYNKKLYFNNTDGGFTNHQNDYGNFISQIKGKHLKRVFDLSEVLKEVDKAYIDKVHYSYFSNEIIAKKINETLLNSPSNR